MIAEIRFDLFCNGVVIAAMIILGSVIMFHNRKSLTAALFLALVVVSSIWSVLNYVSYYVTDSFWTLWTIRLVMFFAVYQALLFFLLMVVFPEKVYRLPKKIIYGLLPWVVCVSLFTLTPFVFSGVASTEGEPPDPKAEPGMLIFALTAIPLVGGGIGVMFRKLREASGKRKTQFRILLLGLALMFLLIILFNFIFAVLLKIPNFVPLGALFIFPFVAATFWAIVKHELLNARIVTTEIFTFVLIILGFIEVLAAQTLAEIVLRTVVFTALLIFGVMLIRATTREVSQRERLEELTQKLKEMDEQKDEFISMAAHELRSPMTAIKGFLSMVLEGDTGQIPEKTREFLADTNTINERLIRLVNNMLNVTRIEEGRLVYQLEEESLSQVARMVFNQFVLEAKRKNIEYRLEIPNEIKDRVSIDTDKINEVMGNMISNAVKYTEQGSINVRLSQPKKNIVRYEVVDTGPGISAAEKEKLFHKFYRVKSNIGKTTGTGLGLYISKLLIEKFHGTIGFDSEVGKGSTFWFELPLLG